MDYFTISPLRDISLVREMVNQSSGDNFTISPLRVTPSL